MSANDRLDTKAGLRRSIDLVGHTLDILDGCGAPPHIAAHLELALSEMKRAIARGDEHGAQPDEV
jgi:hypothetical protein